jgi:WD40 repeat protein
MSSLDGYFSSLVGFFSYSRDDDTGSKGALSALRDAIQWELSGQLGRSIRNFKIWQDKAAIPVGTEWEEQIRLGISQSVFFVPIITPRVFRSENCALEFASFLARERELGRADLVFPILYIPVPELEDEKLWRQDPVLKVVGTRQYYDWRTLRHRDPASPDVAQNIEQFCRNITNALREPWETPPEREQRQHAEAQRAAEHKTAEFEAARIAEEHQRRLAEEAKQREAEAARSAKEEQDRRELEAARIAQAQRQAEEEARQREEERRRDKAAAEQRAEVERAFRAAKAVNSVTAIEAFLAANPGSPFAAEAENLKAALGVRQDAYRRAMAGDDPALLRAFCATYKKGPDVTEARARARFLAPPPEWRLSRPATLVTTAIGAMLMVGAGIFWIEGRPQNPSASVSPAAGAAPVATVAPAATVAASMTPPRSTSAPAAQAARAQSDTVSRPVQTADATPTGPGLAAARPPIAASPLSAKPEAASLNLDKWAFCRPSSTQTTDYTGGPAQPATLRLALSPTQIAGIALRSLAISPDGKTVVTAGDDHVIRVWDAASLKWLREVRGATAPIYAVAFSIDGGLLASASWDGSVRVWDAHTFAPMQTFTATDDKGAPVKLYGVEFEAIGNPQYVDAVGADGIVRIWDLRKQQLVSTPRSPSGNGDPTTGSLSFVPNGSGSFATGNFDGTIKFFDPGHADAITAFPGKVLRVAYSPDGRLLASVGVDDAANQTVKLWNASDHTLFKALDGQRHSAVSVAWSADGKRLLSGGGYKDMTVRLRDVQSGALLQKPFSGHSADVEAVAFHPNQKWLISASEDATMKIWDIASGKELLSVVGLPDGQYLAYSKNGCYTGSADAASYVRYVTRDAQSREHDSGDNGKETMFIPGDSTALLLPQ